ncbi:MAG: hypothetical protein JNK16_05390 [Phycisphaerales bacterium]|nr:hypothetical protein [Phycisphaerales bacterium]
MPQNDREYKMVEEVRRWRREAFEERSRQTVTERAEEEKRLIESLGLTRLVRKPGDAPPASRRTG